MTQSEYEITARDSDNYAMFSSMMVAQFENATRTPIQLFVVDTVVSLFDVYLESLPEEGRQHYNCHTCRHFLNHYGNLVTVDGKGNQKSVLWSFDAPPFFRNAVLQMKSLVESSKIVKVFESSSPDMGTPEVGGWDHLAVTLPSFMIYSNRLKTANQAMAESMEAFRTLNNALEEYSQQTADKAVELLTSDTMYRSETVLPVAKAFQEIKREARGNNRYNQVWRGVFNSALVHIKAGMAGSLMDDIKAGLSAQAIKSRFEEKMNPGNYQRAQVAPTQGNVEQAEKIVERLGIVSSLKRRYARFDEIPEFIWKGYQEKKAPGVFANVAVKQEPVTPVNFDLPATTMTWSKFARTVLPLAKTMEVKLDNPSKFVALVTARDTTAPNILKWDNTFSWYYHGGADADIRQRVESAGGRYANNEIRCSLAWEGVTDLDLHCQAPSPYGHVYYGNKQGILDVDANGGHITSYSPVENMRWPVAVEGRHSFLVRNYCERGTGMTPFKAELEINGMIHSYNGLAHNTGWEEVLFSFDYKRGRPVSLGNSVSSSASWGIAPGAWGKVKGVTTSPDTWGKSDEDGQTFFLLEGCKDSAEGKGRGFFNEMLRGDLREIRKTLESYMATATVEGADNADACGVGYSKDGEWNMIVRVTTNSGSVQIVKIDRWD